MRTPQRFDPEERLLSPPELLTCPHWGDLLVMWHSLAWDKTVQTLERVLALAARPGHCPQAPCPGSRRRLLSAHAHQRAPAGSPSGEEVLGRMGWRRQHQRAPYGEMPTALSSQLVSSASPVRALYPSFSVPLLACHERQPRDRLAQVAKAPGGVRIAREGWAPQGGEPHLGCLRARSPGLPRRSGWRCPQEQTTCAAFLAPLQHFAGPMLAVRSDKPTGLGPAVATVFPHSRPHLCPAPSRRPRAEPLAEAEAACQGALRHRVRQHVGHVLRPEPRTEPGPAGVLTGPGLWPRPLQGPQTPLSHLPTPRGSPGAPAPDADAGVSPRVRHTRSLLTLKGRPPWRVAGIATYERLAPGARGSLELLAPRSEPRLAQWAQGRHAALAPWAQTHQAWPPGAAWRRASAASCHPVSSRPIRAAHVAGPWRDSLDTGRRWPQATPPCSPCALHLDPVSRSSWSGLGHCDEVPGLPRTNHALASRVRDPRRRLLRITGQQGLPQRTLPRPGAWELLPQPPPEAQIREAVRHTPTEDLGQERPRFAAHRQRCRMPRRSLRQTHMHLDHLRQRWSALQPTGTG
jgi:hypothetical protein